MDGTPAAAVFDSVHNLVYASNPAWNRVDVISPSTHQIVNSIPAPSPTGMDLSLDGTQLIVGSNVQQIVSISTASLQVVTRTNVPPIVQGGAMYAIPDLLANTSNGTVLVGMTLNGSPPAYYLEQWNPAAGTFTPRSVPGVNAWIDQLVRTGDGAKALVVDYGSEVNMAVYDAASDSFSASGQSPVGQVLGVAGSPTAEQFAIIGTNGLAFVDSNLRTLATIQLGVFFSGMRYSPDGTKLYITAISYVPPCGPYYPELLTYDATSYALAGVAPAFQTASGALCPDPPYLVATPLAADNTGFNYSAFNHGLVLDDAANLQNILSLPGGPPFPAVSSADEAALNMPLETGLGQINYDVLPDVWFANTRGTNVQSSGGLVSVTAPPSPTAGLANVKAVLPDGWFALAPQGFSYGTQILFVGGNAGSPQGGASLALIGYGLIGNAGSPTVTIGGQPAKVAGYAKYVDFNDSGFNAIYPFGGVDEVMVVVPAGSPGAADITITSSAGTDALPKAFTYLPAVTDYSSADAFSFVLYDSQRHWVYLNSGNHIDVFSADTNQFLSPIVPPTLSGTRQLQGLALTPDFSKLLVANVSDLSLAIINPDDPSSATAVKIVPSGLPNNPGPYAVAATSTSQAFITTGVCGSAPVYVLDLSTLHVTTPFNSNFICGGSSLWPTPSGDYILMGNNLWSAATNQWTAGLDLVGDSLAVSGDGHWFASDYTRLDSQMIQHSQAQPPEFFSSLLYFTDLVGEKLNASGSLLYTPVPQGFAASESNGVDITDTNHGAWLGQILLTEQIKTSGAQTTMDFDERGDRLFLLTNHGLTVVQLSAPPLAIGYLNPTVGPISGGTTVTIRGSGFESGATVSFGGTAVTTTLVDASTLQVVTPRASAGGARVVIQNPDGSSYSLDAAFSYQ